LTVGCIFVDPRFDPNPDSPDRKHRHILEVVIIIPPPKRRNLNSGEPVVAFLLKDPLCHPFKAYCRRESSGHHGAGPFEFRARRGQNRNRLSDGAGFSGSGGAEHEPCHSLERAEVESEHQRPIIRLGRCILIRSRYDNGKSCNLRMRWTTWVLTRSRAAAG